MIRRRTLLSSALAAGAALGLAACGSEGADDAASTSAGSDGDVLSQVTFGGEPGAEPTVSFTAPLSFTSTASRIVTPGDGDAIGERDMLALQTMLVNAADGSTLQSSWQGAPASYLAVNGEGTDKDTAAFLQSATIGSRIAMLGSVRSQSGASYDVIQVSDIVSKALTRAEGAPQPVPEGMPAFTLADDGAPALSGTPDMAVPDTTAQAVTIVGTGAETAAGDALAMHYTGWKLSDGTQFDSSWARGAPFGFTLGQGQVITGWDESLVGKTVGSQVLLVIPPAEAYGGQDNELAEETLIFVADILGATAPAGS
ncbi:FKBP-type peptidyl-prolyl cis-trans isomerase [Brachybacterium huguangmaarense]|uniref:Peptidyl-prolyl cis-trans isomerase n=1 Tax=Brachybacterium huguangmaarense TaxID=1652028 RepID=A0ABY6FZC9_9MICO|nr:FKBP-type peptidyl-prolyl cis-trans isomerase [Brachybacterium huguangmaarense]UYG16304.1 FKBP-type peptidyl-prolyl cis-trans isomerase [Brachybacterium huguangmaarense]